MSQKTTVAAREIDTRFVAKRSAAPEATLKSSLLRPDANGAERRQEDNRDCNAGQGIDHLAVCITDPRTLGPTSKPTSISPMTAD